MKKVINCAIGGLFLAIAATSCADDSGKAVAPATENAVTTPAVSVPETNQVAKSSTKNADEKLVYELIESMYAGIALMKDGVQKATDPAVKALANKLVTEHTKLTNELEALSRKKNWALPTGEPAMDMEKRAAMGKEDVGQFQKDWLQSLRERHETNIGKLENAKPEDADVKAAGEKGLPKVKALLEDIKSVQSKMK